MKRYLFLTVTTLLVVFPGVFSQPGKIRIGICSDLHVNLMHDARQRLGTFISTMNSKNPDFIIELGDFTTSDDKYSWCFGIWNSFRGAKYHTIGNHEQDGGFSLQKVLGDRGMQSPFYSFDMKGFHFMVLNCNDKKNPESKPYYRYIGPEQVSWISKDLASASHPVIVFSHQELFKGAVNDGIENYREIQEIFQMHNSNNPSNRVIACFNGHTHLDQAELINGIWYVTIASMSYHWLGDDFKHVRYSNEIDSLYPWIKYTAPFRDPLFALVEISSEGTIKIKGKKSEWVGPDPFELGYPEKFRDYMRPAISSVKLNNR